MSEEMEFAVFDGKRILPPPYTDCECEWIFDTRGQAEDLIAARRKRGEDVSGYRVVGRKFQPWAPVGEVQMINWAGACKRFGHAYSGDGDECIYCNR